MVYAIQFLRFVASFVVLVSHSANVLNVPKSITVGDAGVDIFFIISGFVIGTVGPQEPSAGQFWLKRLIRVMPLYWAGLVAFIGFRFYMWRLVPETGDFLHSFFLVPRMEQGWFPILFPAWTLSYEMFFYAVFGLALAASRKYAIQAVSLLFLMLGVVRWPVISQVFDMTLLLEFIAGLTVAVLYRRVWIWRLDRGLGHLLIASAVVIFFVNRTGADVRVMGWGIPSLLLVIGMIQLEGMKFFRKPFVAMLGAASYATYLFHITIMAATREAIASTLHIDPRTTPEVWMPVLVVASLVGGVLAHLYIEKPLLALGKRLLLRSSAGSKIEESSSPKFTHR